jgi:hypothetical protein
LPLVLKIILFSVIGFLLFIRINRVLSIIILEIIIGFNSKALLNILKELL